VINRLELKLCHGVCIGIGNQVFDGFLMQHSRTHIALKNRSWGLPLAKTGDAYFSNHPPVGTLQRLGDLVRVNLDIDPYLVSLTLFESCFHSVPRSSPSQHPQKMVIDVYRITRRHGSGVVIPIPL